MTEGGTIQFADMHIVPNWHPDSCYQDTQVQQEVHASNTGHLDENTLGKHACSLTHSIFYSFSCSLLRWRTTAKELRLCFLQDALPASHKQANHYLSLKCCYLAETFHYLHSRETPFELAELLPLSKTRNTEVISP